MRIEYVLLPKKSNEVNLDSKTIKIILNHCFYKVTKDSFTVKPTKAEYIVNYRISYSSYSNVDLSEKVFCIAFEFEHSRKDRTAEILYYTSQLLASCEKVSQYHLILAFDEVSEYFCNKSYPKFQRFERLMRQLIFKIMTKAFGSLWVEKTISEEIKNNLKKMISIYYPDIAKDKVSRDEKIIEEALYQMDISELEKFLFEESREIDPSILIDSNLTQGSLNNMDKDEIIAVIDKGRLKSLWERFFASEIPIENPKSKISELRILRNKVAHSKPFSLNDYKKAEELHDQFISHLENAIENIEMIKYEPFFISDVLSGFSSALIKSINISEQIGKMISPAISQLADIGLAASKMLQNSLRAQLPDIIKASQIAAQFKPVLPDLSIASKITEQINFRNNLLSTSMAEDILKKQDVVKNAFGARIDYSKLFHNPAIEALENRQRMLDAMIPKFPVFDAIQRQEIDDLEDDQLADEKIDDEEHLNCDDVINSEEDTQND